MFVIFTFIHNVSQVNTYVEDPVKLLQAGAVLSL